MCDFEKKNTYSIFNIIYLTLNTRITLLTLKSKGKKNGEKLRKPKSPEEKRTKRKPPTIYSIPPMTQHPMFSSLFPSFLLRPSPPNIYHNPSLSSSPSLTPHFSFIALIKWTTISTPTPYRPLLSNKNSNTHSASPAASPTAAAATTSATTALRPPSPPMRSPP